MESSERSRVCSEGNMAEQWTTAKEVYDKLWYLLELHADKIYRLVNNGYCRTKHVIVVLHKPVSLV